jgi:ribonuclease HI
MEEQVIVYTDGACRGNPGPGGWGALLKFRDRERELFGAEADTTNNRMELTAAIEALGVLSRPCSVRLFTDSVYVSKGISEWLPKWVRNNWRTANKAPVKNVDLWQRLDQLCGKHRVEWQWVKGHAGDPGNERADQLANLGIDQLLGQRKAI